MQKRMLALGDSYTIGEAVSEEDRWPNQLVELLNKRGNSFAPPEIIAQTGWTTDELMSAIKEKNIQQTFDLVSLLIGVNNQYRGYSLEQYKLEFKELLNVALKYAGGDLNKIVVVSIPDWGATPFAADRDRIQISKEIDRFNAANMAITNQMGIKYAEITVASRNAATNPSLIASDGLHPSKEMYMEWAQKVLKLIE
jgi:lysophospholipase L1-like esterase